MDKNQKHYFKCLDFLLRMQWHLQFTPTANRFQIQAYATAHDLLSQQTTTAGVEAGKGIGKKMLEHFAEIAKNKKPKTLTEIENNGPPFTVRELTRLAGIGPKTAAKLYTEYGVKSLADLGNRIQQHKITDAKLVAAYLDMGAVDERMPRAVIAEYMDPVIARIQSEVSKAVGVEVTVQHVGSFRRHRADIRDIDILIDCEHNDAVKAVKQVATKYMKAKANVLDKEGVRKCEIQVTVAGHARKLDVYFINKRNWGTALLHFTGPEAYNIWVRKHARRHGYRVNQYNVKSLKKGTVRRFGKEKEVCEYLGIPYLEPELRDNFLVFNDVKSNKNASLVEVGSVKYDLHVHSTGSDGKSTVSGLLTMHKQLAKHGLKCVCISDHSKGTGAGQEPEQMHKHIQSIRDLGARKKIHVLVGSETDIKVNGDLAYPDKLLKRLDYVILATHHSTDRNVTDRLLSGIKHVAELGVPAFLAHPTNRIIGYRSASVGVDWKRVLSACAETQTLIEINGQDDRIDATEEIMRLGKQLGCGFVLSSDFHGTEYMHRLRLLTQATMQARRGALTKEDVWNTSTKAMRKWLGEERWLRVFGGKEK